MKAIGLGALFVLSLVATSARATESQDSTRAKVVTYSEARQNFDRSRLPNLRALYSNSGAFTRSIAAIGMQNPKFPIRNAENVKLLSQEIDSCKAGNGTITKDCGNLTVWPSLVRSFFLSEAEPLGSSFKFPADLRAQIVDFLFYILNRSTSRFEVEKGNGPSSLSEVWSTTSENHLATTQVVFYLAAHILSNEPQYANVLLQNGKRPEEILRDWSAHWHQYADERIKYGPFIEINSFKYSKYTITALFNLHDFTPDAGLRAKLQKLLNINFAMAAVETLPNGIRSGSQSRKSHGDRAYFGGYLNYFNYYVVQPTAASSNETLSPSVFTSSYFPAEPAWRVWGSGAQEASYEVSTRVPGVLDVKTKTYLDPTRSVFRTTYMTPRFSLGSNLMNFRDNSYVKISSEARSLSLYINEGNKDLQAKDVPQILFQPKEGQCFDQSNGVQKKNALIFQNHIQAFLFTDTDLRNCYGFNHLGKAPNASGYQRIVTSSRTDSSGKRFSMSFLLADQVKGTGDDETRMQSDMEFSSSFKTERSSDRKHLFMRSPGNSTFIWVMPFASDFEIVDGYNENSGKREANFFKKDMILTSDKFSPIVMVAAPAENYDGNFNAFKDEVASFSRMSYVKNKVTFRQSLRSSLEVGDVFVDSTKASIVPGKKWLAKSSASAHDGQLLVAQEYGSALDLPLTVSRDGMFYLKARVANAENFFIQVNNDRAVSAKAVKTSSVEWQDVKVFNGNNGIFLKKGTHRIRLLFRKVGVEFDALAALYQRNDNPSSIEFFENLNNQQPLSKIDGQEIDKLEPFQDFTMHSPYVKSKRGSGVWEFTLEDGKTVTLGSNESSP